MQIKVRVLGVSLVVTGLSLLFFSLTFDLIGVGELTGFGPAQATGTVAGLILIGLGVFLSRLNASIKVDLVNSFLLLVSIVFALFLGEMFARYIFHAWPFEQEPRVIPYLMTTDENLRWRYPSGEGKNSLGLRNEEVSSKKDDVCRILFLGDSLVFLGETSSGELYTHIIEKNLNSQFIFMESKQQFEIINAGIPGYTTYQELEFLKQYGLEMQPDLVILAFVFNDLYYKYIYKPTEDNFFELDPEARLNRFNTRSFPGILIARSFLAHETFFAIDVLAKRIQNYPDFPFEKKLDFYLAWKDYGWGRTRELISEMQMLLEERNIPLVIVVFPVTDQVDDRYLSIDRDYVLYPQARISALLNDLNVPYLDLTEPIYENGGVELYQDYVHLNNKGNDLVAVEVTNYLTDNMKFFFNNCFQE